MICYDVRGSHRNRFYKTKDHRPVVLHPNHPQCPGSSQFTLYICTLFTRLYYVFRFFNEQRPTRR